MTRIERSALLQYPAEDLFDLINDIEAYPSFMDGCVGATVLARGSDWVEARLELVKGGIRQRFTTRNRLCRPGSITMELVEGPFEHFEGRWQIDSLTERGSKVTLQLAFDLRRSFARPALRRLFDSMANTQVDALCRRARVLYG
jgi:ribosome-associated toxin RatA of RatAB toxin-antitoxin module